MNKGYQKRFTAFLTAFFLLFTSLASSYVVYADGESQEASRSEILQSEAFRSEASRSEAFRPTDDFIAASEHQFEGVGASALQRVLDDGRQIYQYLRVQSDITGTMMYRVPVQESEIEYVISFMEGTLSERDANANPFTVTRIMDSGRSHADSIVVILLSDGFTAAQYSTALNHAQNTMDAMLSTHPFGLFEDLVTVYLIHTTGNHSATGIGYLGTVRSDSGAAGGTTVSGSSSTTRSARIRELANSVVAPANQDMIQVISNAGDGTGWAWIGWHYLMNVSIGVTSVRNSHNPPGGHNTVWPNGTAWHGTFIHEFGHSFGKLVDEHSDKVSRGERYANSTQATGANVKWSHWFGHRRVLNTPTHFTSGSAAGWTVPAAVSGVAGQSGCLMRASWGNRDFCGVCTAELVRRLSLVSGETFIGRSPMTTNPLPNTPVITIPEGTLRILDSAFHGNTSLNTITIPESVSIMGDFAFIGATGLETIINSSIIPQQINDTTFAGVDRTNVEVHIPAGTTEAYIEAGWVNFKLIDANNPITNVTAYPATFDYEGGYSTVTVTGSDFIPSNMKIAAFFNNSSDALYMETPTGSAESVSATLTFPENSDPASRMYSIRVSLDEGATWLFTPATVTVNSSADITLTPDYTSAMADVGAGVEGRVSIAVQNTSNTIRDVTLQGSPGTTNANDPALFNAAGERIAFQNNGWNFTYTITLLPEEIWHGFVGTGGDVARNYIVSSSWSAPPPTDRTWYAAVSGVGTITPTTGSAEPGDQITLMLNEEDGYYLTGIALAGRDIVQETVTYSIAARTITFIMPSGTGVLDVTITPTWTPIPTYVTITTNNLPTAIRNQQYSTQLTATGALTLWFVFAVPQEAQEAQESIAAAAARLLDPDEYEYDLEEVGSEDFASEESNSEDFDSENFNLSESTTPSALQHYPIIPPDTSDSYDSYDSSNTSDSSDTSDSYDRYYDDIMDDRVEDFLAEFEAMHSGLLTGLTTGLPAGLTINQLTGVISGVPTSTGVYTFVVMAFNPIYMLSDTRVLSITVEEAEVYGDVSGNGAVTPFDATLIAMYLAGHDITPFLAPGRTLDETRAAMKVTRGSMDIGFARPIDATTIALYLVGQIPYLPCLVR